MVEKLDLRKTLKAFYLPSAREPVLVDVPAFQFIMVDGSGDPNTAPLYVETIKILYNLSYGLKFLVKKTLGVDYPVMALEGLWWVEDMALFSTTRKQDWLWTMMMLQPDIVTPELFVQVQEEVLKKKELPLAAQARLETFHEGTSVQIMYFGPYSDEGPTITRMHAFAIEQGYRLEGKHHEIYIGDPRRSAPEKLKTVIRQPVRK